MDSHLDPDRNLQPRSPARSTSSRTSKSKTSINTRKDKIMRLSPEKPERRRSKPRSAKSGRYRASRLSRERQIPALNIHTAQFPISEYRLRGKLRWLFEHEMDFLQSIPPGLLHSGLAEAAPSDHARILLNDQELNDNNCDDRNVGATENPLETQSYHECSGGDGDVSEGESEKELDLFELQHWREEPSSPLSYEGPSVTRAPSECSSVSDVSDNALVETAEMEDWGVEDWKLQAEVLMAECNLLRIEKELAVRRWQQGCVEMDQAVCMARALRAAVRSMPTETKTNREDTGKFESPHRLRLQSEPDALHDRLEKIQNTLRCSELYKNSSFAREAVRRLEKLQSISSSCSGTSQALNGPEDPTEALQKRLENLLLAAHSSEHESLECNSSQHTRDDPWEASRLEDCAITFAAQSDVEQDPKLIGPLSGNSADEMRCLIETAALRKQLDFLSSELTETQAAASLIRKEYRSMLSGKNHVARASERRSTEEQEIADEVFCKAAIRQIAEQVQAETEQWSQVQDILHHVQKEMEDLHDAREMWEERALHAEAQIVALQEMVHDWRCRARTAEEEVASLQSEIQVLKNKIEKVKHRHAVEQSRWLDAGSRLKQSLTSTTGTQQMNKYGVNRVEEQEMDGRNDASGTLDGYEKSGSIEMGSSHSGDKAAHQNQIHSHASYSEALSSADLHKSIKKSLDFSHNSDGSSSKIRHNKKPKVPSEQMELELNKKMKKSKQSLKENRRSGHKSSSKSMVAVLEANGCAQIDTANQQQLQQGVSACKNLNCVKHIEPVDVSMSKLSLAAATRSPFGEIINSGSSSAVRKKLTLTKLPLAPADSTTNTFQELSPSN